MPPARRPGHVRRRGGAPLHHGHRDAHDQRRRRAGRPPEPEVLVVPGGPGSTQAAEDEALLAGSARPTRPPSGPPRSAPARSSSGPPACSTASTPRPTGSDMDMLERYGARPTEKRVVEQGKIDHGRRGVLGDRHGADARRANDATTRSPRRSSWASSTTPSPRSTPAPRAPRHRRRSRWCAPWSPRGTPLPLYRRCAPAEPAVPQNRRCAAGRAGASAGRLLYRPVRGQLIALVAAFAAVAAVLPAAAAACDTGRRARPPSPAGTPPLALGDSVMLGAVDRLVAAGFEVNARAAARWPRA